MRTYVIVMYTHKSAYNCVSSNRNASSLRVCDNRDDGWAGGLRSLAVYTYVYNDIN